LIVTIHQPEHLPWLGFFNKIDQADLFVLLDVVQFRKNYFQNRNRILGPGGTAWITVPVQTKGHMSRTILDMEIGHVPQGKGGGDWRDRHRDQIRSAYGSHPQFDVVFPGLDRLYMQEWRYLVDVNEAIIRHFISLLGITTPIVRASQLDVDGSSSSLLLHISRRVGADVYLSGPSGRDYLDESMFEAAGVEVRYQEFRHPTYPQSGRTDFTSHLSTIDLLSNCGQDSLSIIRQGSPSGGSG
jgi:hypothetical protein